MSHTYNVAVCVVCHTRIMLLSVWYVTQVYNVAVYVNITHV